MVSIGPTAALLLLLTFCPGSPGTMVSRGPTAALLLPLTFCPGIPGVAGQSCNQSIRTAQAARPQKVHQKEEKGLAAEAAACKYVDPTGSC